MSYKTDNLNVTVNPTFTSVLYLLGIILYAVDSYFVLGLPWWILCLPFVIPFIGVILLLVFCIVTTICVFVMTICTLLWTAIGQCASKFYR